ncbi:MAG TPA: hypothetical protein DCY13_10670 [Verrucomicrobiales bacterium]|nr:hypothetical protein [Verrucomicrobiales bacterium]
MARSVKATGGSYVLELGPGTGAITDAILRGGVPENRLVVIEKSPVLARVLRRRYPRAHVMEGDAACIQEIVHARLGLNAGQFSHIVSSLPLRSIPKPVAELIARGIQDFLSQGASLVQFTYDLRNGSVGWFGRLQHVRSSVVWLNVPPARVDEYFATEAHSVAVPPVLCEGHAGPGVTSLRS